MTAQFSRLLDLTKTLSTKSAFLFGPRGSGKSTWIQKQLPTARVYDLLDERVYLKLLNSSALIDEENPVDNSLIVIDEIQKLPKLLDEVQRLIFKKSHRFLLSGSSARKLKRGGANLLAGRARELHMFPLVSHEIPHFDLVRFLNRGGLPAIYLSDEPKEDLRSYISLYLREEIAAEALARKVDQFSRFLEILALQNGEELHFQNMSSDSGVKVSTIKNYIEILEDTLLGFQLPPFDSTMKRKAISRSKFYYFDIGVVNSLTKRGALSQGSELFGRAFEHFIALELRAALSYFKCDSKLTYWRTKSGFEVDFIVGHDVAIEVKALPQVSERHLKGLRALGDEKLVKRKLVISLDSAKRTVDKSIEILPWQEFLSSLWNGDYFER